MNEKNNANKQDNKVIKAAKEVGKDILEEVAIEVVKTTGEKIEEHLIERRLNSSDKKVRMDLLTQINRTITIADLINKNIEYYKYMFSEDEIKIAEEAIKKPVLFKSKIRMMICSTPVKQMKKKEFQLWMDTYNKAVQAIEST